MNGFEVVDPAGLELGEHPIWDPGSGRVGWVDVLAGVLRWVDGEGAVCWQFPAPLGAAAMRRAGGVVAAAGDGIHFRDADGRVNREPITGFLPRGVRFNDAGCDPAGNFVCGTTSLTGEPGAGSLYRVSPEGAVETLATGITESNGLAWSWDGGTFYYVDSGEPVVRRYHYSVELPPERDDDLCLVPEGQGIPDGLCVDVEGALWIAMWAGGVLWRVSSRGELLDVIEAPVSRPTCPGFGGPELDRLFVATAWEGLGEAERRAEPLAGHLLAYRPPAAGVLPHLFGG